MKQSTAQTILSVSIRWTATVVSVAAISFLAEGAPRIMKKDPNGRAGTCTGPLLGSVDQVLARNRVHTKHASRAQKLSLAKGMQQLERLAGGPFAPAKGATFNFINTRGGKSNQGAMINMRGGESRTANTAYLMHELGHRVGNSGYYSRYRSAVRTPCIATHYCKKNYPRHGHRNEEFAEVFAAFVTHPEVLQNGSRSCRAAYNYFATRVFKNGRQLASCGAATALVARGKDPLRMIRHLASASTPAVGERTALLRCSTEAKKKSDRGLSQLADYLDDEAHASEEL